MNETLLSNCCKSLFDFDWYSNRSSCIWCTLFARGYTFFLIVESTSSIFISTKSFSLTSLTSSSPSNLYGKDSLFLMMSISRISCSSLVFFSSSPYFLPMLSTILASSFYRSVISRKALSNLSFCISSSFFVLACSRTISFSDSLILLSNISIILSIFWSRPSILAVILRLVSIMPCLWLSFSLRT